MRKIVIATILTAMALSTVVACASPPPVGANGEPMEELAIVTDTGEHDFWVEVADDEEERRLGLMYRPPLPDDHGMLFEFPDSRERSFWMRNTPSSLDIIYVGGDGRIVSIARNTTPNSDSSIASNGPATGVIELRAGRAAEISADPGDQIVHPFFAAD